MNLKHEDLEEFSRIWREEFHEEISEDEARRHASSLMELYFVLARPLAEEIQSKHVQAIDPYEVLPVLQKVK